MSIQIPRRFIYMCMLWYKLWHWSKMSFDHVLMSAKLSVPFVGMFNFLYLKANQRAVFCDLFNTPTYVL